MNTFDMPKWPVNHNSQIFFEDDCGPMFLDLYEGKFQLTWDGCIYLGEGMVLTPDDEIITYD